MTRQAVVLCVLGWSLVGGGCGGGDSAPSGDAGAGGSAGDSGVPGTGGSPVSDAAAGTGGAPGNSGVDADAAGSKDLAADAPATGSDSGMPPSAAPTIPASGELYCMAGPQPSDAAAYIYGWSSFCVVVTADAPPVTMAQKNTLASYCAFMVGGKEVTSCPRDNVVAYCQAPVGYMSGLTATRLLYKSNILPDGETSAANPLGACVLATQYEPAGKSLARDCKGTISIKVDGQLKDFSKKRACSWKTDGTQSEYFVSADTDAGDRVMFVIHKTADGKYDYGNGPVAKGASYLEGGTKAFVIPTDPAAAMLTVTKYEAKGAGLAATFSPGTLKSGTDMRTLTEGSVDIQIAAP